MTPSTEPLSRIAVRPDVCHGRPCIRGTRVLVAQVVDLLAAGKSVDQITTDYFPEIGRSDIIAAVEFSAAANAPSRESWEVY